MTHSLLIKNVRPMGGDVADILIRDGAIEKMAPGIDAPGVTIEAGGGAIAMPGLVDAHNHPDKTLIGMGWKPHQAGPTLKSRIETERRLRGKLGIDPELQTARLIAQCLSFGTTAMRSHVDVDTDVKLTNITGVAAAREAHLDVMDMQIVAFPQSGILNDPGTFELMDAAMAAGADLVGGIDPSAMDRDARGHLDAVFSLAEKHGKPIDIHLHEEGELGAFSMDLIVERTRALGMQGSVTISHAFCLGSCDPGRTSGLIEALADARISIATAALVFRPSPSAIALRDAGVALCAGNDGIRDTWTPFGTGDMLERAMFLALRNSFRTDPELEHALWACTQGGADVLKLEGYGLAEGQAGDVVLVDAETIGETVAVHPNRRMLVKAGRVLHRNAAQMDQELQ